MAAYLLFHVLEVRDEDAFAAYRARVEATVARHGGRYLVRGGDASPIEGDWHLDGPVLIAFPSSAAARSWYASDDYAPLKALRFSALDARGILLEGVA